jgi:hypothetical protein
VGRGQGRARGNLPRRRSRGHHRGRSQLCVEREVAASPGEE